MGVEYRARSSIHRVMVAMFLDIIPISG